MDIQTLMNMLDKASHDMRSETMMTLGRLIKAAEKAPQDGVVRFADGGYPAGEDSYRGYYSDLSFSSSETPVTVADFLKRARGALGETYYGYKGGDYTMTAETPVWRAEYGSCGEAIVLAQVMDGDLVLFCRPEDED